MADVRYQGKPLSLWVQLLRDHSVHQRREAAVALAAVGITAVPELIRLFKSGKGPDHFWAIRTLGMIGEAAKPAVPVVLLALRDPHDEIRHEARAVLERIDPQAAAKQFGLW